MAGGFRIGPFELMDLVGIDVGFEVAQSFTELSFGEPRWKPNPIQARMAAAGRLGRKTGRGFYDYPPGGPHRQPDPAPPTAGGGDGWMTAILGTGPVADDLRERARAAGYELRDGGPAGLVGDAGLEPAENPPLEGRRLVELTRLPTAHAFAAEAAEGFFRRLGLAAQWVEDAPDSCSAGSSASW
jgi:3-hydroxybutyryl-CoA dehydrogenase